MPTYQYRCTTCSRELEAVQKFSDAPLTLCPECHGRLRKVFSPVGVVFKGSGFYSTDSRTSGRSAVAGAKKEQVGVSAQAGVSGQTRESGQTSESGASAKPAEVHGGSGKPSPATEGSIAA